MVRCHRSSVSLNAKHSGCSTEIVSFLLSVHCSDRTVLFMMIRKTTRCRLHLPCDTTYLLTNATCIYVPDVRRRLLLKEITRYPPIITTITTTTLPAIRPPRVYCYINLHTSDVRRRLPVVFLKDLTVSTHHNKQQRRYVEPHTTIRLGRAARRRPNNDNQTKRGKEASERKSIIFLKPK